MKPILIIDPGHGGTDPGCSGNGIREKDYTLQISLYQFERFKQLGVPVAITRTADVTLDSGPRTNAVKNSGAKYCISNHINAAASTSAQGAETIHSIHSDGKLATAIMNALVSAGLPKRRVFCKANSDGKTDYYYMHRLTGNVSTVIVEYDFATNSEGAERIKKNWQKYAEAVVQAFCQFAGFPYYPPSEQAMFRDVPDNHWARTSIEKAAKAGIMVGVAPGLFGLGEPLTREQFVSVLDRLGLLK